MNNSYENRAIRMLLQPSIHLYNILRHYSDDDSTTILSHLANEEINELIIFLGNLIDNINEEIEGAHGEAMNIVPEKELELITLKLHIRLFINSLRESYATVRDLLYHKDDSNVINILSIVNDVLSKELKDNNIVIPDHVLTGIQTKVKDAFKDVFTPKKDDSMDNPIINNMEYKNLKKLNRKK